MDFIDRLAQALFNLIKIPLLLIFIIVIGILVAKFILLIGLYK